MSWAPHRTSNKPPLRCWGKNGDDAAPPCTAAVVLSPLRKTAKHKLAGGNGIKLDLFPLFSQLVP
jgi:hypothetical protein